jgi:hypothetical protein
MTTEYGRKVKAASDLAIVEDVKQKAIKYADIIVEMGIPMNEEKRSKCCIHDVSTSYRTIYGFWQVDNAMGTNDLYLRLCDSCWDDVMHYESAISNKQNAEEALEVEEHKKAKEDALFDIAVAVKRILARLDKLEMKS